MSPRVKVDGRQRLLEAAERLVLAGGVGRLSVEAVIREAGLSKGAFFHHFGSKDELLLGLVAGLAPPAPDLRTRVAAAFDGASGDRTRQRALVLAFIEAALVRPSLVKAARAAARDGLPAGGPREASLGDALVAQLALDGYWLNECLGGRPLNTRQRAALRGRLLALARRRRAG
jgi:AcrR family transcriptional regulator